MRTIDELREEKRIAEHQVYYLKEELLNEKINSVDKNVYMSLQDEISSLQKDINNDIIYIKNTYNQLLEIRKNAEILLRQKNDEEALHISKKVHQAFLLLVKCNEELEKKILKYKKLLESNEALIEVHATNSVIEEYKECIVQQQKIIKDLNEELQRAESQRSISVETKNRVIKELQEYQNQVNILENKIRKNEAQIVALSRNAPVCRCGVKFELRLNPYTSDVFFGCPNFKEPTIHSKAEPYRGDKEIARQILSELNETKKEINQLKPPRISLDNEEKTSLQTLDVKLEEYPKSLVEYPNIEESNSYNNYLFQSLCVPNKDISKEFFNELIDYSRFRIFTKLPKENKISDEIRTICSLALRLMNRGIVVPSYQKTASKIKRCFANENEQTFLSILNDYATYKKPQNKYDSIREKEFAEYYFPLILGDSWATYVYTQMPIETLIKSSKEYKNQRVDYFVCYRGRKLVIELDGEEHKKKTESDYKRDEKLEANGYKVIRFSNKEVDERSNQILCQLKKLLLTRNNSDVADISKKHIVACKIVHQTSIAILKMLEEGHITFSCNLNLEVSTNLFTEEEIQLILLFAVEEVSDLLSNFAKLYGLDINLDLLNGNGEKYFIKIGDGDNNRNTIVIRDIVLPINYLCSIHPFSLVLPEKDSVTEEIMEFFLQYVYGYAQFRAGQFAAIRRTLRREESIVLLPTGSGKSVIYQLCSMLLPGITVVISPLRALIEDQVSNLSDKGVNNVAAIYSADDTSKEEMLKKASAIMKNHSAMMLYIAPERMQMPDFRKEIKLQLETNNFCLVAIDEAHCVSEWGHDFRAPYLQIGRSCRKVFRKNDFVPPIIALTGTASDNVLRDVKRDLEITNDDAIISPPSFDREELQFSVVPCSKEDKFKCLKRLLNDELPKKFGISPSEFKKINGNETKTGIVFTPLARKPGSTYAAWDLFCRLNAESNGLQIGTYFSSPPFSLVTQEEDKRDEIWQSMIKSYAKEFKENQKQLLVATKAFGMGIDKSNIRYVIHYGLSTSIEQYYQEVGRAGRDSSNSKCVMLFSNSNDVNDVLLNPNADWSDFKEQYAKYNKDGESDDLSPMLFFHVNNFKGTIFEKSILSDVLCCIKEKCANFDSGTECVVSVYNVYRKNQERKTNDNTAYDNFANNVAKAIIRLVTLGVLQDYEYDYSQKEYHIVLGNIVQESVLNHYLNFVDGCSRGRKDDEKLHLCKVNADDFEFLDIVADRYIDLVYETIEKGRRRALQSMYRLAKESSKIKDSNEQDKYIRTEIQNYLVKDDTVDIVNSSNIYTGVYEILRMYPLYPNDVVIDIIEQENAKKTNGYAARVLESNPYHPGLLYLSAITAIKSGKPNKNDVKNDIVAALQNSSRYSIPNDVSIEFFVKVLNLAFNSSSDLFEYVWESVDGKYAKEIIDKVSVLTSEEISNDFKNYLLLHIKSQSLRKIIGGKN